MIYNFAILKVCFVEKTINDNFNVFQICDIRIFAK